MKKIFFNILMSLTLILGSVASVYSGTNLPDEKTKKCCKSGKKECKEGKKEECKGEKKSCCSGKKEKKTEEAAPEVK